VTDPAVGADLGEALDRLRPLSSEVAFDLIVLVDVITELGDLFLGQVAHLRVGRELEPLADLARRGLADSEDVSQPDLETLLVGKVDAGDSCHANLALPLLVAGIRADDERPAVTLDHTAALAHGFD
jgi:hypothetical protein